MLKQVLFLFFVLCTIQVQARVQHIINDTVQNTVSCSKAELLQSVEPSYLDGVVIPAKGSGNWFVTVSGGANAFIGTPLGCEDLFGRLKPTYSISVGKWLNPSVGTRINYNGMLFIDGLLSEKRYHHIHADLMWNVFGKRFTKQENVPWTLAPYIGAGIIHHGNNGHNPFALSYGIQGQYQISKRISVVMELSGMSTFQDFDGIGKMNRPGDNMLAITAGFSINIGKVGWERAIDGASCLRQNEKLVKSVNHLLEENRNYVITHEKDKNVIRELKKILEIKGVLEEYSHLFVADSAQINDYPRNNYSGLNSLMARLKNKKWNGQYLNDITTSDTIYNSSESLCDSNRVRLSNILEVKCRSSKDSTLYINNLGEFMEGAIGSPIYFFFNLNSAQFTDESQSINLDALACVAIKYNLSVKVVGAADKETGTNVINDSLSLLRANYIREQLLMRGVPSEKILVDSKGGISDYSPVAANRNTRVELFVPNKATEEGAFQQ